MANQNLSVVLTNPQDKADLGLAVSNIGGADAMVFVAFSVPGKTAAETKAIVELLPAQITVPAGSTVPLVLTFQRMAPSGTLAGFVVMSGGGTTAAVPVTVSTGIEPISDLPLQLVVIALILGVSIALFRAWTVPDIVSKLSYPLGNIGWSFSDSWATNLTAIGAILGTVASVGLLPTEPMLLSKGTYAGLSVFFGTLVVLAPFLFIATAKLGLSAERKQQRDGYTGWFLVSASLTVTAVTGQLMTLAALLADGFLRGTSALLIGIVAAVVGVGGIFVLVHAWRTIPWTIRTFARQPSVEDQSIDAGDRVANISLL